MGYSLRPLGKTQAVPFTPHLTVGYSIVHSGCPALAGIQVCNLGYEASGPCDFESEFQCVSETLANSKHQEETL